MKLRNIILVLSLFLSACGPSPEQIQKAIEETQEAGIVAKSQAATPTLKPTSIPTATPDRYKEIRQDFFQAIDELLLQLPIVDKVKSISADQGKVEIEWITTSTQKMEQADYSFIMVGLLSKFLTQMSEDELVPVSNGKPFLLKVITFSKDERYKHVVEFDYDMLKRWFEALNSSNYAEIDGIMNEANGRFE